MSSVSPVIHFESSDAKKTAAGAMSSVQIAMIAGLPYTAFRDAILTHPTLAEGLGALFSSEQTN